VRAWELVLHGSCRACASQKKERKTHG
jgi:hypothetical protein